MTGIPEPKTKHFYHKSWFIELLSFLGALIAGLPAAAIAIGRIFYPQASTNANELALAWIGLAGVFLLIVTGVVKILQGSWKDTHEADEERYDGLRASVRLIHSLVRQYYGFDQKETEKLRVTIHRIVKPKPRRSPEELEQVIDYVGGSGGGKGRKFSIRSGITGKAAREKDVFSASRTNADHESYIKELISLWGYTEDDARRLSATRNSWLAVPIKYSSGEVTGIVYLDSAEKDFFPDEVKKLVVWACDGVANFIDERYK
ncbi:MAG: hypothetical protein ACKVQJ_00245 [Pyrinomonadaceae bacterium]